MDEERLEAVVSKVVKEVLGDINWEDTGNLVASLEQAMSGLEDVYDLLADWRTENEEFLGWYFQSDMDMNTSRLTDMVEKYLKALDKEIAYQNSRRGV